MTALARARRTYGLPETMLRHMTVGLLTAGAVVAQGGTLAVAINVGLVSWLASAIGLGVLTAIIARGLTGVLFLVFGFGIGVSILLATNEGSTAAASLALIRDGYLYGAALVLAAEAYLITLIVLMWVRSRR